MLPTDYRYPPRMSKTLAGRIQQARERAGISQSDLARACKVSPQAVHIWESGGGLRQKTLLTVAKALHVKPEWLLFGGDVQTPELTQEKLSAGNGSASHFAGPDPVILHEAVTLLLFDLDHGGPRPARSASDLLLDLYRRLESSGGRLPAAEEQAFEEQARSRGKTGDNVHGKRKAAARPRRAG